MNEIILFVYFIVSVGNEDAVKRCFFDCHRDDLKTQPMQAKAYWSDKVPTVKIWRAEVGDTIPVNCLQGECRWAVLVDFQE